MKIIYNKILPLGRRYYAINLFGVLFAKGPCSPTVVNHERIHTAQMREMLFLFFYIWYVAEWIIKLMKYGDSYRAYRNISFEREAYLHETDLGYLSRRRPFASLRLSGTTH